MHCFNKILKTALPVCVMFAVIIIFHYTNLVFFKYYPVIMNFVLFTFFFGSTFQEKTIIQRFALMMEPDAKPPVMVYTRNLTYIWAVFMFTNFLISLATVFMSEKVWAVYNGFVSYMLVGLFFVVEYIIRINFKRKHDC